MADKKSPWDTGIVIHSPDGAERPGRARQGLGRTGRLLAGLGVTLFILLLLSALTQTDLRNNPCTLQEYLEKISGRMSDFASLLLRGENVNGIGYILCTCLSAALTGAALASAGAVYQGIFRNPMASPSMLGIQSGGILGGVLYILFFMNDETVFTFYTQREYTRILSEMSFFERNLQAVFILAGCVLGAALVVTSAMRAGRGRMSTLVLFLSGSIFSSVCGALVMLAEYYLVLRDADTSRLLAVQTINMGSFGGAYSPAHLLALSLLVLPPLAVLMLLRRRLSALTLGDDEALSLGVNPDRLRRWCFILCTLMVGGTLAMVGRIAFIGLLAPHLARRLSGPGMERLLPVSALLGAVLMVLIFDVAGFSGFASMINVVTTSVGGLVFIAVLAWHRRRGNADWA